MMNKNMKKAVTMGLTATMAALIVFGCCACGSNSSNNTSASSAVSTSAETVGGSSVVNPVHEGTAEEVLEKTGMSFELPSNAENVTYSYIDGADGEEPIAQATFTLDGNEYCYRMQAATAEISLGDKNVKVQELFDNFEDALEAGKTFSGMYYEWDTAGTTVVGQCDGVEGMNDGKEGYIYWCDPVAGIQYSISMNEGATQKLLEETANTIYTPAQGED